jgi:F-type H+-transporting ATPase subunit delta
MATNAGVVAIRYANALAAVIQDKKLDLVSARAQLTDFSETFASSGPLREVLMDPSIPNEQKLGVLDGIAARLGMFREVRNFLAIITDHQRLHELNVILDAYDRVADIDLGVTEAEVSTVHELNDADRAGLEAEVEKLAGTKVRVAYTLDATLLGGAVVKIGSTVYDGSVKTQLEQMKRTLMGAA